MYPRAIQATLAEALSDTPVVWPLAQSELNRRGSSVIDRLFAGDFAQSYPFDRSDFITRLVAGGYPEATQRTSYQSEGDSEREHRKDALSTQVILHASRPIFRRGLKQHNPRNQIFDKRAASKISIQ